jgi:hypothetical protein
MKWIRVPYKSGWFTVIIPTLTFLTVWFGSFLLALALLGWNVSDWVGMLLCAGGILPGLIVSAAIYPLLLRLAARGQGRLSLEGPTLRWRIGFRQGKINLAQPHDARIAADPTGAGLTLQGNKAYVNIHFRGLPRQDVLEFFPAPFFVDDVFITPEMGSWGFDTAVDDATVRDFAVALLETLWGQRQKNRHFLLYQKFPWSRCPQPDFPYVRLIEWERRSVTEEAFIQQLEQQFVDGLSDSYVRATPDYLVGWVYRSVRSTLSGQPDYYCVMPLGYISAEASLPQPDWEPFIIGHVLKEALATALKTTAPAGGPYLEDRHYLYVRGQSEDGAPLELAFDWYGPADDGYDEAQFLVRFVYAMRQQKRTSGKMRP